MTTPLESLNHVSRIWLDPRNALRSQTIQALQVSTGLSRHQIEMALKNAFEEFSQEAMQPFVSQRPLPSFTKPVLHILPSNVFTSWLPGAVLTLLLGRTCWLKPSLQEPVFAPAWMKSIQSVDDALAERVRVVPWSEDLLGQVDVVVAYGSDQTLRSIREKVLPPVVWVGYGHKISIGIVFAEAIAGNQLTRTLDALRADLEPFDLQGCLSPQILFVQTHELGPWHQVAGEFPNRPEIRPFETWKQIADALGPIRASLSSAGIAGLPAQRQAIEAQAADLGFSRVCPLGTMQRPPLRWLNGGISLAEVLNAIPVASSVGNA